MRIWEFIMTAIITGTMKQLKDLGIDVGRGFRLEMFVDLLGLDVARFGHRPVVIDVQRATIPRSFTARKGTPAILSTTATFHR